MIEDDKDPFGRPIESYPPIVLTPEQARVRMAKVDAEERETPAEESAKQEPEA